MRWIGLKQVVPCAVVFQVVFQGHEAPPEGAHREAAVPGWAGGCAARCAGVGQTCRGRLVSGPRRGQHPRPRPADLRRGRARRAGGGLWATDAAEGIIAIDLADPDAPVVADPVDLGGSAQEVAVEGDVLYVATGGGGVVLLDRLTLTELGRAETGGSTRSVSVEDGVMWVADYEAISAWDVADPTAPTPLGHSPVEQFAMAVTVACGRAWLGDWGRVEGWSWTGAAVGSLDSPGDDLWIEDGAGSLSLTNRGGGRLRLHGARLDVAGTIRVGATELEPLESTTLSVSGVSGEGVLCLATDDPAAPVREYPLVASLEAPLGEAAPDFTLTDLDGDSWRLSELRGHVVMLDYFATW